MSTSYYPLHEPITDLTVVKRGSLEIINLWTKNGGLGALVMSVEERRQFLLLLTVECDVVAHYSGGMLEYSPNRIGEDQCIISEMGDRTTIRRLRQKYNNVIEGDLG